MIATPAGLADLHLIFTMAALAESLADPREAQDRLPPGAGRPERGRGQLPDYRPSAGPGP
ncbi:hypothetical protein AB0M54_17470 [Actinoplanes sp. NPDC051470]|uniref:hypothetical protein n=1 Tax=Actinoplanes sp. NPDC051470 TaxID=3157224 RepID=UPI003420DC43